MLMDIKKYDDKSTHFLKRVAAELNTPGDIEHALRVTDSVFNVLRDTIDLKDSDELINLLPYQIADIYTENWDRSKNRAQYVSSEDFYNTLRSASMTVPLDFYNDTEARQAVQAIFKALREPLPGNLFERIKNQLPKPVKTNV